MSASRILQTLVLIVAIAPSGSSAMAQTAFTYQGQLKDGGVPADGSHNLTFKLFDSVGGVGQVGSTVARNGVVLTNGLFSETLDFGSGAFTGAPRWLEVSVNGSALTPRQAITPAPYALYALGGPGGSGPWQIAGSNISNTNTGNVGIGTSVPTTKLDVRGDITLDAGGSVGLFTGTAAAELNRFLLLINSPLHQSASGLKAGGVLVSDDYFLANPGKNELIVKGRVGIGTPTPSYPLTIQTPGGTFAASYGWVHTNGTVEVGSYVSSSGGWLGTRSNHPLYFFTDDSSPQMTLTTTGALGIGTSTVPAGVKLAVDGKILCEEMEVQLSGDWPDYVFGESYALMPLSELEKSVEEHKHLPGIPSAADVARNGVNVGQMQAQLVEKVEELTLYMIQMNKQLERVALENSELKTRLAALEGNP